MGIILNGIIENVSTKPSEMRAFLKLINYEIM